ncbi:tetratricopeptide repeat protein [Oceanobacillus sp. M65]|uniref:tetratricopeptide repeat protein n=1 Tax=Oceanobacillus sp. M65 TaxID=3457435 RepID=UPI003FCE095D
MIKVLQKAIELRETENHKESNQILIELVKDYPKNASINYQCAWSFDLLGEEAKAVPFYEKAIELGLEENELQEAILGLGSTYRTLGEYEKSKLTLQKGLEAFPHNKAIQTFYSMTLYNLKEHSKAMKLLLRCLVETTSDEKIISYKRAIHFYSDKLDETW